jgi:hypothetical protein
MPVTLQTVTCLLSLACCPLTAVPCLLPPESCLPTLVHAECFLLASVELLNVLLLSHHRLSPFPAVYQLLSPISCLPIAVSCLQMLVL